ncbi:MAG: TlpA family protein disulfide reductase [Acidobacteria bacterium]|nr:TlpA family protein disulfide reductase [Acidobacteriota bacterium]
MLRRVFQLALRAVIVALCFGTLAPDATADGNGENAIIKLRGVDGKTYDLAEMRGEVVIISFGATWCKPCEWELAAVEDLKREFQGQPVRFLWVSIEGEEVSDRRLRDYAKSLKMTIPVLRDPTQAAIAQFTERVRLPTVVFFDKEGAFVPPKHTGMSRNPEEYKNFMRARLNALLIVINTDAVKE